MKRPFLTLVLNFELIKEIEKLAKQSNLTRHGLVKKIVLEGIKQIQEQQINKGEENVAR